MIYYTSDLHLGHRNILKMEAKDFERLEDRESLIISNWNSKVKQSDTVYILGDMFYGRHLNYKEVLSRLKGKKVLVKGNHDQWIENNKELEKLFEEVCDYKMIQDEGRKVILFHYPIAEWNHKHYNSYHLYGHVHERRSKTTEYMDLLKNCYNVCIQVHDYYPVTLDELVLAYELDNE